MKRRSDSPRDNVGLLRCCVLILNLYVAQGQAQCTPVPPSHGDVQLFPSGRVLIYMGPDGTDVPYLWGTLNGFNNHGEVAKTLCQQLGYNDGSVTTGIGNETEITNWMVWLSNITCPSQYQPKHILRCNSSINSVDSSAVRDHSNDIHLDCMQPSTRTPHPSDVNTYVGQSTLMPPSSALWCNRSRSYGAVTIKHYSWRWDYIRNDSTLNQNDTDTICRDMGYTHSVRNSLLTVGQSKLTFKDHSYLFTQFGHIDSSQFNCTRSCPCIGCCYNLTNYTGPGQPDPRLDVLVDVDDKAVLIRCSFYTPVSPSTQPIPGGHRDVCEVLGINGTIKKHDLCPSTSGNSDDVTFTKREFAAIVTAPICFLLLIIIGVCFAWPVYLWWRGRRGHGQGYNPVPRANDGDGGGGGNVRGNNQAGGGNGGNQGN